MNEELKTKLRIWAYDRMWDTINKVLEGESK